MKNYIVNGFMRRYPEGHAPEGAILVVKTEKAEPAKEEPIEKKAIKKPANKAKKAGANK